MLCPDQSPDDRVDRRLAAILASDVAGYSRLMGADEEGTLHHLKAHRKELVDPKITEHRGRIVKTTGDGMLVEFVSVVDAVRCAVEIQRNMVDRNASVSEETRIQFRFGINIGDIIIDGDDIFGDGVNVAARLEALADAGGIMVSGVVHDQVRDKLAFGFEDLGEQMVKNIAHPVGVHRIKLADPTVAMLSNTSAVRLDVPGSAGFERPSIAVLPFSNMSADAEQEYFADGITEEIITGLSKLRWFFVIARNSVFIYKSKAIDIKRVTRELGVRYVLEGSVRKSGNRLRITAQLIDASTGNHIWADRYDGDLADVFSLEDEITKRVVAAIEPRLLEAEGLRSQNRSSEDLDAWDLLIKANSLFWRLTRPEVETSIGILREALARYPNYGPAYSLLAFVLLIRTYLGWSVSSERGEAARLAGRAAELDDSDPWAHLALGFVAFVRRQTSVSASEFRRAIDLNPNFAAAHGYLGWTLAFDGQSDEAIKHLEEAVRLSPHDPQNTIFNTGLAVAHYLEGRYGKAVEFSSSTLQQRSAFTPGQRIHVASLAQNGQLEDARKSLAELKQVHPDLSIAWIEQNVPYQAEPMLKFLEGMRKAGLQ